MVLDHLNRLIGEVLREVIALFRCGRRLDESVVFGEVRIPLVGFSAQESVESIESHPQGPTIPAGA